ncbi:MAG: rhamnulokinase [Solobacterium sp.]|nr:rhamnulokinase [Solobacterium sp.]
MNYYLAIDIGASSGRHILGHLENDKMVLEEVYRFSNGMKKKDGHLIWDVDALFEHILLGMKKCKERNIVPVSMGIDTWAVDYVLLDEAGNRIQDVYGYRDSRMKGIDKEIYKIICEEDLYLRTGIQKQIFNTIYQLKTEDKLDEANCMLMIPDYFNYLLSGQKITEYTNASTTQLVSPITKDWDYELIELLGYPKHIFTKIKKPGYVVGNLRQEIQKIVGFDTRVVLPATHDTASAVLAIPSNEDSLYISSGTWSLMGCELKEANCSLESKERNFTNEGGIDYRFRYLKNIMGMWMINSMKHEIANEYSFNDICEMAKKETITSIIDAQDHRFLAPVSMVEEVQNACFENGQEVPQTIGQIAKVIYQSLAECYKNVAKEIECLTGKQYSCIHIVGGGSQAMYLNELTAKACKKTVYAGPVEATSIGNIAAQMISNHELIDLYEARKCIFDSFEIVKAEGE